MHVFRLKGAAAEVRWGYHRAAELSQWEYDGTTLTATVVQSDPFAVSQQPLTFVVNDWKWPITTLQITGSTLTASLVQ